MCLIPTKIVVSKYIAMNDSMSILLATSLLALGGLGLYMYKSSNPEDTVDEVKDKGHSFFGGIWNDDNDDEDVDELVGEDDEKPLRKRASAKTQRNKKTTGTSKRRYY